MIYGGGYNLISLMAVFFAAVICITLHEYAHGYVALLNGDRTAKFNGRLTLNPIKHFDPFGFMMLIFVGFGYAKPVPVNPNNFRHLKKGIFTVAIAGVTVNLILAFLSTPIYLLLLKKLNSTSQYENLFNIIYFFYSFFFYLLHINVALALFNLLPLYPLDGFRVLEAFTRYNNKVTSFLRAYGSYILIGLIGMGIIIDWLDLKTHGVIFEYLDVLGFYINYFGGLIREKLFVAFWRLLGVGV